MKEIIVRAQELLGPIDGILHAGRNADNENIIQQRTRVMIEKEMAPKIRGTLVLDALLKDLKPDFFVLFAPEGNVLHKLTGDRVGDNASHEFFDAYACFKSYRKGTFTTAISWNVAYEEDKNGEVGTWDYSALIDVFERILEHDQVQVIVSDKDIELMLQRRDQKSDKETGEEKNLPNSMYQRRNISTEYTAPKSDVEKTLVQVWQKFFTIEQVGIHDDFFELGGDSLKATTIIDLVHRDLGVRVPLSEMFKTPTIRHLAHYIRTAEPNSFITDDLRLVQFKAVTGSTTHLFLIHDGTGEVEGYNEFCKHLNNDFNCWGIRAERLKNLTPRNVTVQELAKTYIESMKKIQPHGPYYIAGWSLGGIITFEIAAQLEQTNEEIAFLALFDSPPTDKNPWKNAGEFNLKSELNFIKNYDIGSEIDEKLKKLEGIDFDQFWSFVADYLKTTNFKIETVKKTVIEQGMRAFPNYDQLGIREFIYSLNIFRTLINAGERYIPAGKINTQAHYFKATQSKGIKQNRWNKYCRKSIKCYMIPGDHFSIFKIPDVVKLTETFVNVLDTSETVTENNINEQQL
jgi:thioesterase domain-containing protein/acyl carrier protein